MTGLLLLKHRTAASARSPEFRYLESCVAAAARRVFGAVEIVHWQRDCDTDLPERVPVLVIGRQNVHLGERSLQRMKSALEAGAGLVLPHRLASFPRGGEEPIYTLRAFERLEQRLLDQEPGEWRRSHLPVALLAAELARSQPLASLMTDQQLDLGEEIAHAGIFHDYIDYYGEVREDILPFIPADARDLLEIGCGRGLTGQLIRRQRGCRVTGVELNPDVAAEAARHLDRVIVGDIEELEIDQRFDAVVATELFEHLVYPEEFLAKMKTLVRPGGRIVLSVPNVGHYSLVEDLLAGRWDYLPIGLLCYTHFRFFTRATLEAWIERVGFDSYEITAQRTELPERFTALPQRPPGGNVGGGPQPFEVDLESLATKGFYVVLTVQ